MREDIKHKLDGCIKAGTGIINLENMKINDGDVLDVIQGLKRFRLNISTINLDGNNLSDKGAFVLTEGLQGFDHLTELSLQFNDIDKDGAMALFSLKKELPDLDILFHGNKIRDVGEMDDIEKSALACAGMKY